MAMAKLLLALRIAWQVQKKSEFFCLNLTQVQSRIWVQALVQNNHGRTSLGPKNSLVTLKNLSLNLDIWSFGITFDTKNSSVALRNPSSNLVLLSLKDTNNKKVWNTYLWVDDLFLDGLEHS